MENSLTILHQKHTFLELLKQRSQKEGKMGSNNMAGEAKGKGQGISTKYTMA